MGASMSKGEAHKRATSIGEPARGHSAVECRDEGEAFAPLGCRGSGFGEACFIQVEQPGRPPHRAPAQPAGISQVKAAARKCGRFNKQLTVENMTSAQGADGLRSAQRNGHDTGLRGDHYPTSLR